MGGGGGGGGGVVEDIFHLAEKWTYICNTFIATLSMTSSQVLIENTISQSLKCPHTDTMYICNWRP